MRVAVVSPETIHHRDADDTRRLQRLVRGLTDRGHTVHVCCARWWTGEAPSPDAGTASGATDDGIRGNSQPNRHTDAEATAATADPDELPPAGNAAAGTATDRPPGETALGPDAADDGTDEQAAATVTVEGVTYRGVVNDPTDDRAFASRAPLSIRRAKPDVIHAVADRPAAVVGARVGSTLARAPILGEWYDPSRADTAKWSTRQALSKPRRIVTPSRLTRRQLLELDVPDERLRVIPNAIDLDQIESIEPAESADVVFARRLDGDANLESLLLGLAELRDRGWSATVIGDGPHRREYEQQVRDLRIDDRVTFAGALDRSERIARYRGAHAFVQTARRCVFATELCWALAAGCVGIVEYHADSSAHELVEGRDRGFRTTTPQETADAIVEAGDLERLDLDRSYESFDEGTVLGQYEDSYEELRDGYGLL